MDLSRIFRFIISGGLGAFANIALLYVLVEYVKVYYVVASLIATAGSLVLGFVLHKYFTFKENSKEEIPRQGYLYTGVALVNTIANASLLFIFVDIFDLHYLIGQIFTSGIIAFSTFFLYRSFVFTSSLAKLPLFFRHLFWVLFSGLFAVLLVFGATGLYDTRVDAHIYLSQIEAFDRGAPLDVSSEVLMRAFKPLYGFVGALFIPFISGEQAILFINIVLFAILLVSAYSLFLLLGFSGPMSAAGGAWIAFSYPVLKYGLALSTDISGWAFAIATIALGLWGIKQNKNGYLILASLFASLGALSKETALSGFGFVGLAILFYAGRETFRVTAQRVFYLLAPIFVVWGGHTLLLLGKAPSFFDWFSSNTESIEGYQTFQYLFFTEASTFNFLWVYALIGLYFLFLNREEQKEKLYFLGFFFLVTIPVLLWPIYISRILYIQFLWVIPLSLFGLTFLLSFFKNNEKHKQIAGAILVLLPIISSATLFLLSDGGSLYFLLDGVKSVFSQ